MKTVKCRNWDDYRAFVSDYTSQSRERRGQFVFRGHADSQWELLTTLDREIVLQSDEARDQYYRGLLIQFRKEATALISSQANLPAGESFDLLARHHGVPSPILDWTESPYIASFFAFEDATSMPKRSVAIWAFDRAVATPHGNDIEIIDDIDMIRANRRALQQRGVFTRVRTMLRPVEDILAGALTKVTIPSTWKARALADLDEMGINAAMLFSDLDGAARTARYRLRPEGR